jgi:hypothetical protein
MRAIVSGANATDLLAMKERLTGSRPNTRRLDPHEDALRGADPAPKSRLPWGLLVYAALFLGLLTTAGFVFQDLLEGLLQ